MDRITHKRICLGRVLLFPILGLLLATQVSLAQQSAHGKHAAVVTAHPLASEIALDILKGGGNAVDAAVAAAFALSLVEPHASGLGGGGAMLFLPAGSEQAFYIDYYVRATSNPALDYDHESDRRTAKAVCVPGTAAGLSTALEKYGTWPLKDLLNFVADRLDSGFVVDDVFYSIVLDHLLLIASNPTLADLFLEEGFPKEPGTRIVNTKHLDTYRRIAERGPEEFYQGAIADSLAAIVQRNGGTLARSDLARYQAEQKTPVASEYRGFRILSAPPPQSGVTVIETLNILENVDLASLGHYESSWQSFHFFIEALRRAQADRYAYLSDPDFADVPLAALLSQEYADIRFKEIRPGQAWPELMRDTPSGDPFEFGKTDTLRLEQKPHDDGSTSHISIVDAAGNAVSLTQTLNLFWGSGVVVEGFVLNNGMTGFGQTNPYNTIKPWRRPRSTISPTIILKDGRPFLVIGSPGSGRIISAIVETVCSIIDFGMAPEEANAAPRFAALPAAGSVLVEARFPEDLIDRLQKAGHQFEKLGEMDLFFGGVQMILIDRSTGTLHGSSDPRRSGVALAY